MRPDTDAYIFSKLLWKVRVSKIILHNYCSLKDLSWDSKVLLSYSYTFNSYYLFKVVVIKNKGVTFSWIIIKVLENVIKVLIPIKLFWVWYLKNNHLSGIYIRKN